MRVDYFDIILKGSKLPTKWLHFYVKVRFPIGIVIALFWLIKSLFTSIDFAVLDTRLLIFVILAYILDLVNITLLVRTYIEMRAMTSTGYKLNIVYLYFFAVYYPFTTAIANIDTFWENFIANVFWGSVWLISNLVYFHKRKGLFYMGKAVNHVKQAVAIENEIRVETQNEVQDEILADKDITSAHDDIFTTIEKLNKLKEKGILTEQEFTQKKLQLLDKI